MFEEVSFSLLSSVDGFSDGLFSLSVGIDSSWMISQSDGASPSHSMSVGVVISVVAVAIGGDGDGRRGGVRDSYRLDGLELSAADAESWGVSNECCLSAS